MEDLYPAGPQNITDDLMKPTAGYKKGALIALASLISFILLYIALTGWFIWKAYTLFNDSMTGGDEAIFGFGFAAAAAFLALFLVKALFFVKHSGIISDLEITEQEEPKLFEFLYRLADEAGAPRPHRVFLSNRVNAAVFYNLTLLNLIFPSKKNLEIGLPLVNSLTLGELKAVLAHEFGHFRQGSMVIGRWIYIAQQIATHIIQERGALDKFLNGLSRFDLRIAWIGWILKLVVWSLRAILDTVFSLVILAERSLSREMEFHADLVSVSLTGSDALIHALHKLGAADDAWDRSLEIAGAELNEGKAVEDIFMIQKLVSMNIKRILDDETYDEAPPIPNNNPEKHRVFKTETAHPPRMWSTHPANHAREKNAKKTYVAAPLDDRSAWELFSDAKALRLKITNDILNLEQQEGIEKLDGSGIISTINSRYKRQMFNRRYKGTYLNRSITQEFESPAGMYKHFDVNQDLQNLSKSLYSEEFSDLLEESRNLQEQIDIFQALYDGTMTTPEGIIRHRGNVLKKSDLPSVIEDLQEELNQIKLKVNEHDKSIRGAYRAMAKQIGNGWEEHLTGLVKQLHYAEHSKAELNDVRGHINNVWAVITADGHISNKEVKRLLKSAEDVYNTLTSLENDKNKIVLCPKVAEAMGIEKWTELLNEDLNSKLSMPVKDNINDWLSVIDSWFNYFGGALNLLCSHTLDTLLASEEYVEKTYLDKTQAIEAPSSAKLPEDYKVLLPEAKRELQKKLGWWDRFQTADGFFPALARFCIAGTIFGSIFLFGIFAGKATITVYNGLSIPVTVASSDNKTYVQPYSHSSLDVDAIDGLEIISTSQNGELIEKINVNASNSFIDYVYNIASAAPLIEWTEIYGEANEKPNRYLGSPNWITTKADYLFIDPPETVKTDGAGTTRDILSGFGEVSPYDVADYLPENTDLKPMILAHAKWDSAKSKESLNWLSYATEYPEEFSIILQKRLDRDPNEIISLRLAQQFDKVSGSNSVCESHIEKSKSLPDNLDWKYLATRCIEDETLKSLNFMKLHAQNPEHPWLAFAAGYDHAAMAEWEKGIAGLKVMFDAEPAMREYVVDPLVRMYRISSEDHANDFNTVLAESQHLNSLYQIENGENLVNEFYQAYHMLSQGQINESFNLVTDFEEPSKYNLLRLAAASDGADNKLVQEANNLTVEQGITNNTYWSALALAMKHNIDTKPLLQLVETEPGSETAIILQFINSIKDKIDYKEAEALLTGLTPSMRGHAYTMALILHGDKAPKEWRSAVKKLLFSVERPYFL